MPAIGQKRVFRNKQKEAVNRFMNSSSVSKISLEKKKNLLDSIINDNSLMAMIFKENMAKFKVYEPKTNKVVVIKPFVYKKTDSQIGFDYEGRNFNLSVNEKEGLVSLENIIEDNDCKFISKINTNLTDNSNDVNMEESSSFYIGKKKYDLNNLSLNDKNIIFDYFNNTNYEVADIVKDEMITSENVKLWLLEPNTFEKTLHEVQNQILNKHLTIGCKKFTVFKTDGTIEEFDNEKAYNQFLKEFKKQQQNKNKKTEKMFYSLTDKDGYEEYKTRLKNASENYKKNMYDRWNLTPSNKDLEQLQNDVKNNVSGAKDFYQLLKDNEIIIETPLDGVVHIDSPVQVFSLELFEENAYKEKDENTNQSEMIHEVSVDKGVEYKSIYTSSHKLRGKDAKLTYFENGDFLLEKDNDKIRFEEDKFNNLSALDVETLKQMKMDLKNIIKNQHLGRNPLKSVKNLQEEVNKEYKFKSKSLKLINKLNGSNNRLKNLRAFNRLVYNPRLSHKHRMRMISDYNILKRTLGRNLARQQVFEFLSKENFKIKNLEGKNGVFELFNTKDVNVLKKSNRPEVIALLIKNNLLSTESVTTGFPFLPHKLRIKGLMKNNDVVKTAMIESGNFDKKLIDELYTDASKTSHKINLEKLIAMGNRILDNEDFKNNGIVKIMDILTREANDRLQNNEEIPTEIIDFAKRVSQTNRNYKLIDFPNKDVQLACINGWGTQWERFVDSKDETLRLEAVKRASSAYKFEALENRMDDIEEIQLLAIEKNVDLEEYAKSNNIKVLLATANKISNLPSSQRTQALIDILDRIDSIYSNEADRQNEENFLNKLKLDFPRKNEAFELNDMAKKNRDIVNEYRNQMKEIKIINNDMVNEINRFNEGLNASNEAPNLIACYETEIDKLKNINLKGQYKYVEVNGIKTIAPIGKNEKVKTSDIAIVNGKMIDGILNEFDIKISEQKNLILSSSSLKMYQRKIQELKDKYEDNDRKIYGENGIQSKFDIAYKEYIDSKEKLYNLLDKIENDLDNNPKLRGRGDFREFKEEISRGNYAMNKNDKLDKNSVLIEIDGKQYTKEEIINSIWNKNKIAVYNVVSKALENPENCKHVLEDTSTLKIALNQEKTSWIDSGKLDNDLFDKLIEHPRGEIRKLVADTGYKPEILIFDKNSSVAESALKQLNTKIQAHNLPADITALQNLYEISSKENAKCQIAKVMGENGIGSIDAFANIDPNIRDSYLKGIKEAKKSNGVPNYRIEKWWKENGSEALSTQRANATILNAIKGLTEEKILNPENQENLEMYVKGLEYECSSKDVNIEKWDEFKKNNSKNYINNSQNRLELSSMYKDWASGVLQNLKKDVEHKKIYQNVKANTQTPKVVDDSKEIEKVIDDLANSKKEINKALKEQLNQMPINELIAVVNGYSNQKGNTAEYRIALEIFSKKYSEEKNKEAVKKVLEAENQTSKTVSAMKSIVEANDKQIQNREAFKNNMASNQTNEELVLENSNDIAAAQ